MDIKAEFQSAVSLLDSVTAEINDTKYQELNDIDRQLLGEQQIALQGIIAVMRMRAGRANVEL